MGGLDCSARFGASAGRPARRRHDYPAACTAFEQSQALFEALGDRRGEAAALFGLGAATQDLIGDYDLAQRYLQDSLAIRRTLDDRLGMIETLDYVSQNARYRGQIAESEQLARESYVLSTTLGNHRAMALAATIWECRELERELC